MELLYKYVCAGTDKQRRRHLLEAARLPDGRCIWRRTVTGPFPHAVDNLPECSSTYGNGPNDTPFLTEQEALARAGYPTEVPQSIR